MNPVVCVESAEELYNDAPCGYLYANGSGHILQVNRTFVEWSGFSVVELTGGMRFTDLLTPGGRIFYETHLRPILRMDGRASELALDVVAKNGGRLPALVSVKRKMDADGGMLFDRITVFHASERRRYENEVLLARKRAEEAAADLARLNAELITARDELTRKNAELEWLNAEKNRLLGMAAHDLRNPLTVIGGFCDLLLDDVPDDASPRRARCLEIIRSSGKFMLRLVNDLLDVAKIESGRVDLHLEPTRLIALIEENLSMNRLLTEKKRIRLTFRCDGDPGEVMIDPSRVQQLLNNLISNAAKFSRAGTEVEVSVATGVDEVVLRVKDQGPGIPAAERDRLFQPFGTTSVRSTDGESSTGLGLTIAHKVVEAHRGRIWVESEVGVGTTVCVGLPIGG